jgi:hypothetical protein
MARKKNYFGNEISPSCSYCAFGNRSREGNKVLCEKQGLVDADYSCKKWVYDLIVYFLNKEGYLK